MSFEALPEPNQQWLKSFFYDGLWDGGHYSIDRTPCQIKLDQNEASWDWPIQIKQQIAAKMVLEPWNKYPDPYVGDVAEAIAKYSGFNPENIVIGPGSHHVLCLALSIFSQRRQGQLVVARPSFPLYESHAKNYGIEKRLWNLTQDFEYDVQDLDDLPDHSYVVFASPNNPVGNILEFDKLKYLLKKHPTSMFFADEAYFEFSPQPYTSLVHQFPNLMLLRTLSKGLASAGIRLGYAVASKSVKNTLAKVTLPYLVNRFSAVAVSEILTDPSCLDYMQSQVRHTIVERDKLYDSLLEVSRGKRFEVFKSHANFLLLRLTSTNAANSFYCQLRDQFSILVRDVSRGPMLEGCLRVTVGTESENRAFIAAVDKSLRDMVASAS